jgi:hypothetical protein
VAGTIIASVVLFTAGCGSDDTTSGSAATTAPSDVASSANSDTTSASTDDAETVEVSMVDISFDPADITVPVGTTVVWTNEDTVDRFARTSNPGPASPRRMGERSGVRARRRWTGIEPAGRGSPVPTALKAAEPTRCPDTSAGDITR